MTDVEQTQVDTPFTCEELEKLSDEVLEAIWREELRRWLFRPYEKEADHA